MTFREPLPVDCPPTEAVEITEPLIVYRIVRHVPPLDTDFRSQRTMFPDRHFPSVSECQARGLSVHDDIRESQLLLNLRSFRGCTICQVNLNRGAGYIQRTGRRSHFTWWPLADYDIRANCLVVAL